jgi:SAM-dependent methyltransferase
MNILGKLKYYGFVGSVKRIIKRFLPKNMKNLGKLKYYFKDKIGLEIGGPSQMFSNNGYLPIYKLASVLDGVNFSGNTIWTGNIDSKNGYIINGKKAGTLYITDATDLSMVSDNSYDFLLSCNNIEHIANPMKALQQWILKLKEGGIIVIIAPRKESNFDHNRETVKFEHILDDFNKNIDEKDLTHLEEILKLHDLKMDPPAGNYEQFRLRSLDNYKNRCLHHHVFNFDVLENMLKYFNMEIIYKENIGSNYIIIGKK